MADISLLMFTYRPPGSLREIFIREALASLRAQVGVEIQAIILDDGSPTVLPPELYADTPNIKFTYEHFPKRAGKINMMNIGIPRFEAPLCTSLHDDDYFYDSESLLKRYKFFQSVPDTAMIFTNALYVQMSGKKVVSSKLLYDPSLRINHTHEALMTGGNYICGASYLIRTDLKKSVRVDPRITHAEELCYWLFASKFARDNKLSIRYSPEVTACYRLHEAQAWNSVKKLSRDQKNRMYLNLIREKYGK